MEGLSLSLTEVVDMEMTCLGCVKICLGHRPVFGEVTVRPKEGKEQYEGGTSD